MVKNSCVQSVRCVRYDLLPILMFISKCSKGLDESALIRWETCGPEVARTVSEFEDSLYSQNASS